MAKPKEVEEEEETPDKWEGFGDLFEGEDDAVVASAKARHLASQMRERAEELKRKSKKKKGSAWL